MDLKTYVTAERGRAAALAGAIGVSPVMVSQWINSAKAVPAERCPAIERATNGAVRCEELRPDIEWSVLREQASETVEPSAATKPTEAPVATNGDEGQPHTAISMGEDARSPERDDSTEADESYRRWREKQKSERPR